MTHVIVNIERTVVKYDKGILFSNVKEIEYVSGYNIKSSNISNKTAYAKWASTTGMTTPKDLLAALEINISL